MKGQVDEGVISDYKYLVFQVDNFSTFLYKGCIKNRFADKGS